MENNPFVEKLVALLPIIKIDKIPQGFSSTFNQILSDGNFLDRERINILLSYWHIPPMTDRFYNHYCEENINTIEKFQSSLNKFIKDALWHFGDLERAYLLMNEDDESFDHNFKAHLFDVESFEKRLPWKLIQNIPSEDRGLLGYVSGEKPFRHKRILSTAEEIIKELEDYPNNYSGLSKDEIAEKILDKLKEKMPDVKKATEEIREIISLQDINLFSSVQLENNKKNIALAKAEIERTIEKINEVKKKGKENQEHYLRNIEAMDVYVATSMRDDKEYHEMSEFIKKTFNNEKIKELNLRFFDPTLCYCESRIDKGIIECLLVRSSKITIYCAQDGDTFGKDSELSATLVQGKPAIVYVPKGSDLLDKRAQVFKEFHPLGLQIGVYDGVARGVIVVRSPEESADVLYRILTNSLEVDISFEEHGIVLRESITKSVLRVMTGWGVLSNAFWNNFHKTQETKSGNCL